MKTRRVKADPFNRLRALGGVLEAFDGDVVDECPGISDRMKVFVDTVLTEILVGFVKWDPAHDAKYHPDTVSCATKAVAYLLGSFESREGLKVEDMQGLGILLKSLKSDYVDLVDWEHELELLIEQLSDIKKERRDKDKTLGKAIFRLWQLLRNLRIAKTQMEDQTVVEGCLGFREEGEPATDAMRPFPNEDRWPGGCPDLDALEM